MLFAGQLEGGAVPAHLCEIALNDAECGVVFHPHRHHSIVRYPGIPDPAALIGILGAVRVDDDILAHDLANLRRAGELLVPIGRQGFPLQIGEAKIIKAAAVENRNNHRARAAVGKLRLDQEIRRQLVDGATGLPGRDNKRFPDEAGVATFATLPSRR